MAKGKPIKGANDGDDRNKQVIDLLNVIGKRLIDTEQERDAVKSAMKLLHTRIDDMDGRTDQTERAFVTLQSQINQVEKTEQEFRNLLEKQKSFMDQIERTAALASQIEDSINQQKQITRRLDKVSQDRSRLDRKLDRIEESVMAAQDMINAKAMVLLADKEVVSHAPASSVPVEKPAPANDKIDAWWKPASAGQAIAVACILFLAISTGWLLNEKPFDSIKKTALGVLNTPQEIAFKATRTNGAPTDETEDISSTNKIIASISNDITDKTSTSNEDTLAGVQAQELAAQMNDIMPSSGNIDDTEQPRSPIQNMIPVAFSDDNATDTQHTAKTNGDFDLNNFIASQKPSKPINKVIKRDENLASSMRELENKAFAGDGKAQHDLAIIYAAGHADMDVDYDRALTFFTYAAYNNVPNAAYNLGVLNHQGLGTAQNIEKALGWYYAAANMGHPDALYNLGIAHIEGIGTGYDPIKAEEFFKMSAGQGVMEAAYNLGLIHENGLLGTTNQEEAIYWYNMAAEKNSPEAIEALEQLSKNMGLSAKQVKDIVKQRSQDHSQASTIPSPESIAAAQNNTKKAVPQKVQSKTVQAAPSAEQRIMELTKDIQLQLMDRGLYPGPATGYSNPQTEDAIYSYQAMNELTRTGKVTEALLVHMRSGIEEYGSRE